MTVHLEKKITEQVWLACQLSVMVMEEWCIEAMGSEHLTITELAMDSPVNQNIKVSNM